MAEEDIFNGDKMYSFKNKLINVLVEEVNSTEWVVWITFKENDMVPLKIFISYKNNSYFESISRSYYITDTNVEERLTPICTLFKLEACFFSETLYILPVVKRKIKEMYGL